jgi:acetylglutamate kinase
VTQPVVLKIGGHDIADSEFLTRLAHTVARMTQPVVLVHGGGKEISAMQQKLDIEPQYIDGVRITDALTLSVVTMVLCGTVNKRLVQYLVNSGVDALGLCGVDRGLIQAQKMSHERIDMGFTGAVTDVRAETLHEMLAQGMVPVIAPVCAGSDTHYNVNADHVAGAVAAALDAERLVFLTNVEGVLKEDEMLPELTDIQTNILITKGIIHGGMIPKVETALHALQSGVAQVAITNLAGLVSHGGTVFRRG